MLLELQSIAKRSLMLGAGVAVALACKSGGNGAATAGADELSGGARGTASPSAASGGRDNAETGGSTTTDGTMNGAAPSSSGSAAAGSLNAGSGSDAAGSASEDNTTPEADPTPTEDSSAPVTASTTGVDPRFAVEGSLGIEPELLLDLSLYNGKGGQIFSIHVTDDWLYFGGILSTGAFPTALSVDGRGLFRMRKKPGAVPEPLAALGSSTLGAVFHSDSEHVYYLDWDRILYWRETGPDVPPVLETIPLEGKYIYFGGDDDSVFAYADNCTLLSWVDKASLRVSVAEPPNAFAAGGHTGVTSDGGTLYCTGRQEDNRPLIYEVNKTSGDIVEVVITHEGNGNKLSLAGGYFEKGAIWQIMEPYFFGSLDVTTGVFTTMSQNFAWHQAPVHREPDGKYVYWVTANVWRYHTPDNTYVPLINRNLDIDARSAMDDDYVYFATGDDYSNRPEDPIGLVRVTKP